MPTRSALPAYIVDLEICCTRGEVSLCDFDLTLPWEDSSFYWLTDPRETRCESYRFPSTKLESPRAEVLNHRFGHGLRRGRCLKGLLLGFNMKPIPNEYKHGSILDLNLSVISGVGTFSTPVKFQIDRAADLLRKVAGRPPQDKGLFERAKPDGTLRAREHCTSNQVQIITDGDLIGVHASRKGGDIGTWPSPSGQASRERRTGP